MASRKATREVKNATAPTQRRVELKHVGTGEAVAIPLVAEDVVVGKKKMPTGRVKVSVVPHVRRRCLDVSLLREEVEVERVPINREVNAPPEVRQEGDVTIVPVFEEVLVIQKKLVLKEEVRITRRHKARRETRQVPVRSEEVKIIRSTRPS